MPKQKQIAAQYAMNAIIYARYSTGPEQSENSIDLQLRAAYSYCQAKGFTVVGEYIDRAKSGTTDNRPEFQRMITDAKKGLFAYVIVYRFDRFARNRYDSAIYKKQLQNYGVRVLSTEESIGIGDEGIILESIYEAMAESYSLRLSRVVTNGMREKAAKGYFTGGRIPFGFKVIDHMLAIDEEKAPAVQLAFTMRAERATLTQIADKLNELGFRTKTGKPFGAESITKMLANSMYAGHHDFHEIKRSCPAIVNQELFDSVQEITEREKRSYGRSKESVSYLLSGKLFCGHCGAAMMGECGKNRFGSTYYYYVCGEKKRHHSCNKKREKKDEIEQLICETITAFLSEQNYISKIAKRVYELAKKEAGTSDIQKIEKQLQKIEVDMDAAVDALIKTSAPSAIKRINERITALDERKAVLSEELTRLQMRQECIVTKETIEKYLSSFLVPQKLTKSDQRRLINAFVNAVYVFDDKITIYFNLKNGSAVPNLETVMLDTENASKLCSDSIDLCPPNTANPNCFVTTELFGFVFYFNDPY